MTANVVNISWYASCLPMQDLAPVPNGLNIRSGLCPLFFVTVGGKDEHETPIVFAELEAPVSYFHVVFRLT